MTQAGWFPDPGGQPGRFRYWDGRALVTFATIGDSETQSQVGASRDGVKVEKR